MNRICKKHNFQQRAELGEENVYCEMNVYVENSLLIIKYLVHILDPVILCFQCSSNKDSLFFMSRVMFTLNSC